MVIFLWTQGTQHQAKIRGWDARSLDACRGCDNRRWSSARRRAARQWSFLHQKNHLTKYVTIGTSSSTSLSQKNIINGNNTITQKNFHTWQIQPRRFTKFSFVPHFLVYKSSLGDFFHGYLFTTFSSIKIIFINSSFSYL